MPMKTSFTPTRKPLVLSLMLAFPLLPLAAEEASTLPDLGTPTKNASASITPGPGGITAQGRFDGIKVLIAPEYSNQTGISLDAALAGMLGENAAVGLVLTGGADKKEVLLNAGFKVDERQRVILSVGQLKQSLDFLFPSGKEQVSMAQNSAGLGYQLQLGQEFLRYLEINGYVSNTASRNLADKTFAVDTATLYELWNDPRRIAGGKVEGLQGKLGFTPLEGSLVKVSLGYERLSYDLLNGDDTSHRPTAGLEWQQQFGSGYQARLAAENFASQNRYTLGLERSLADAGGRHSIGLNLIDVHGRDGLGNDRQIQLAYGYTFGSGNVVTQAGSIQPAMPSETRRMGQNNPAGLSAPASNLLDQVAVRPGYMPSRVIAKVDTTAAPTRLVVITKAGLPAGSSIDAVTGDVTVPLGATVTGFAGITKNLAAFTNTGQFVLGSNTLTVRPSQMVQPASGVTDTYVATINNSGGGTTTVTVTVTKGSVRIDSIVVSGGSDTTPDAFSFTDVTGQAVSTWVESNSITVAGITAATAISVSGGEYMIGSGSWTSAAGTVSNGQTVKVRHTTSASNGTATNTVLTIGGVTDTFTSTTVTGYISQGGLTWSPNNTTVPAPGYTGWYTAKNYCTTQTINGQSGWRLPTQAELSSLYSSGALAGQEWTLGDTWSSTPHGTGGYDHYVVDLYDGDVGWDAYASNYFVTCVR